MGTQGHASPSTRKLARAPPADSRLPEAIMPITRGRSPSLQLFPEMPSRAQPWHWNQGVWSQLYSASSQSKHYPRTAGAALEGLTLQHPRLGWKRPISNAQPGLFTTLCRLEVQVKGVPPDGRESVRAQQAGGRLDYTMELAFMEATHPTLTQASSARAPLFFPSFLVL